MAKYEYVILTNYDIDELTEMASEDRCRPGVIEAAYCNTDPHGRLIDADAFKVYLMESVLKFIDHPNYAEAKRVTEDFCRDIDEQPTVLEANK